jgi:hypothetical protein
MPFDQSIPHRTASAPWSSELVVLRDDDRPFQEGSAERLGVDAGTYKFMDGKLRPYFVNQTYTPVYPTEGTLGVSDYDKPDPEFLDTVAAAFRQENLIGSSFASRALALPDADFFKVDPNYDVFDDLDGYETYADRFEQVYNRNAAMAMKADIDQENKDRDILAASGWAPWLLSVGAANILDPTILIPGGAIVKGGRVGYSAAKTALAVSAAAGGATAVQEAGLQATQQLRTPEETLLAVGGSVILGGIVGAAGANRIHLRPDYDTELNR